MRIGSMSCSASMLRRAAGIIRFLTTRAAQPARSPYKHASTGPAAGFSYMEVGRDGRHEADVRHRADYRQLD